MGVWMLDPEVPAFPPASLAEPDEDGLLAVGGDYSVERLLAGLTPQQMKKTISIADRREAIKTACMMAQKGDVVLVAGKGHEDYQEIKGVKHHFDDREVLEEIFKE